MKTRPASRSCRSAARTANLGACASMSGVMPLSAWISEGSARPGLTRVDHSDTTSKRSTSTTPISVMRSVPRRVPVVSRSTMASGAWKRSISFAGCISSMLNHRHDHRHVARLLLDARQPGADCRIAAEVEAAVGGAVRVGVERDVGDRVAPRGEERFLREMLLHDAERLVAALLQARQLGAPGCVRRQVVEDVTRHRHVRLMAVLLEEHPLQHARMRQALAWQERRAFREVMQDGIRFRQEGAVFQLDGRHFAVRVTRQELWRARFALRRIDLHPAIREAKLLRRELHLVTITGIRRPVDTDHETMLAV